MKADPAANVPMWTIPPTVDQQPERDTRRAAIHDWLHRKAPSLAQLYVAACYLVYTLPLPGRARLIAHAVREICNSLPGYVLGVKGGGRVDYVGPIGIIHKQWVSAGLPLEGDAVTAAALEIQPAVSKPLVKLLNEHGSRNTAVELAAQLFAEADPTGRTDPATLAPLAKRWRDDVGWAADFAHDPRQPHETPDLEDMRRRFELVEDHLYGLSGPYFDVVEDMDAILAEANS